MTDEGLWAFIYDYLHGDNTPEQNDMLAYELVHRGIGKGQVIAKFRCPTCKKMLYNLDGFGPGCSVAHGGCGMKAPRGKRKPFEK